MLKTTELLLLGGLQVTGCAYSARSSLPGHIRTIYIPTLENETAEFVLPQLITDELSRRFQSEARLKLAAGPEDADSLLRGKILAYREEPLVFTTTGAGTQQLSVTRRRVRIRLQVEFYDTVAGRPLWSESAMERWGEFDSETESVEEGIRRAVARIAEDILAQAVERW